MNPVAPIFNLLITLMMRFIFWASIKLGTLLGYALGSGAAALRNKMAAKRAMKSKAVSTSQVAAVNQAPARSLFITPEEAVRQSASARSRYLPG